MFGCFYDRESNVYIKTEHSGGKNSLVRSNTNIFVCLDLVPVVPGFGSELHVSACAYGFIFYTGLSEDHCTTL